MQAPKAQSVGKKKDGLPPQTRPTAAPYKPTFADRDMAVNKMYARYQERFGAAASLNPAAAPGKQEEEKQAQSAHTRADGQVDSRSPEMLDDMMMESTGMQRSSAQVSPPALGAGANPSSSKLEQRIQERMQVLGLRLHSEVPPSDNQSFQGSFQRTPRIPIPQAQPAKPTQHLSRFMVEKQASNPMLSAGHNSVSDQTGTSIGVDEQPTSSSRLRTKLADYLSPTAETRDKLGAQAMRQVQQRNQSKDDPLFDIKKRQNARKLFGKLEQTWTPNIIRIKQDAFQTLSAFGQTVPAVPAELVAYSSVQSFGMRKSNDKFVADGGVAILEQTASFDDGNDCNLPIQEKNRSDRNIFQNAMAARHSNISPKPPVPELSTVRPDSGLKSRFLATIAVQKDNWRSTTPKSGGNSKPEEEPEAKSKFNFKLLEEAQKNKFDQIARIQQQTEKILTGKSKQQPEIAKPQESKSFVLKTQPDSIDFTQEVEFQQLETGSYIPHQGQTQSHSVDVFEVVNPPITKPMLSPSSKQSELDGYQYPKEDSLAMYSAENSHSRVQQRYFASSHYRPHMHELGEAPVSAQPTEFTNTDSQIFTTQPDLKSMNGQPSNLSDNKTAKLLSPLEDNSLDNRPNYSEIDRPMKLEFLQDGEPGDDQEFIPQKEESVEEVLEGIQAPPSNDQYLKVESAIQLGKEAVMTALGAGGDSGTSAGSSKLDRLAPLKSIFSGEALERAKMVNKNVDEKIAKIKAMQEQILRPRDVKSRSSLRSGRQMSDHDYNQLTEKLGMVSLRQVHASDVGSEIDDISSSDQGFTDRNKESNAATLEYFSPGSGAKRQGPVTRQRHKQSMDLKDSGLKSLDFTASIPVQNSLDASPQKLLMSEPPTPKDDKVLIMSSTPSLQEEKLFQPRFARQKSSGASSFAAEENNREVKKLRMQNGLLILNKRLSQQATVSKQVFLGKWKTKVQRQRETMTKFIQIVAKQGDAIAQLNVKRSLKTWKQVVDSLVNDEIQSELQEIKKTQRRILENIQKSYTEKHLLKTRAKIFHGWLELYNQRKQEQDNKTEACKRIERVLRRQVRKRQRNFWKALNRMPFVSDLADEEDYSVFSGRANSINGHYYYKNDQSPLSQVRSVSARNQQCPSPGMAISPSYSRATTLDWQNPPSVALKSLEEIQIAKIKGGVKLLTISVNRQLSQAKEPTIKDFFAIWRIRARFQSKGVSPTHLRVEQPLDHWTQHKPSMSSTIVEDHFERTEETRLGMPLIPAKQASFRDKPNKQLTDVYERPSVENNSLKSGTPEHIVRADISNMLNDDSKEETLSDQHQEESPKKETKPERQNEELVTTSDISSVQLDSDDSCFAATVEVIKLAPVKKTRQQMPTTTNVSQIDHTEGKHSRQEFQSVSTDRGDKPQLLLNNMDEDGNNEQLDDEHNISRTPPIDAFSLQSTDGPNDAAAKRDKKGSLGQGTRKSIPTPRMMAEVVSKALAAGRSYDKIVHSSPDAKRNGPRRNVLGSDNSVKGGPDSQQRLRKAPNNHSFNQLTLFSKKSSSVQSKPISISSDPFKKDVDTPQFRRSEISNRQKSQASAKEDPYYELTEPLATIKQKEPAKRQAVKPRQPSAAEQEKQNLMVKLAKVAEAQIAAEAALKEERLREKNRLLAKERDRKTNLLFQKKILRGVPSVAPLALSNVKTGPTSQLLAGMIQGSQAQLQKKGVQKKSVTRNSSVKTSFISITQATQVMNQRSQKHRSEIVTPRKRVVSTKHKTPRDLSTASNASVKKAMQRVNIDACLTNSLKIKMPFGSTHQDKVQSNSVVTSRFSDLTSRSYQVHSHYGQTTTQNPFFKAAIGTKPKKKSQTRQPSNLRRNGSKSSLRSINDRPLQTTYVPPVYKSRAFRSRKRDSQSRNSDIVGKTHTTQDLMISHGATTTMLMTNPQIEIEEQKMSMLETRMQESDSSPLQHEQRQYEEYLHNKNDDLPEQHQFQQEDGRGQSPQQTNIMVTHHSGEDKDDQEGNADDDQDGDDQVDPILGEGQMDPQQDHILISDNQQDACDEEEEGESNRLYQETPVDSSVGYPCSAQRQDQMTPAESSVRQPDSEKRHDQMTPAWIASSIGKKTEDADVYYGHTKKYLTDGVKSREEEPQQKWNSDRHLIPATQPLYEEEEVKESVGAGSEQLPKNNLPTRSDQISSGLGENFALFRSQGQSPAEMQVADRRMTFGKASDQMMAAAAQEASQQEAILDQRDVQAYQAGFQRLEGALFHRLERYKVELFIHLCEVLDSEDGDGEDGESEEEDVYGSGNYQLPQRLSDADDQFAQYYQQ